MDSHYLKRTTFSLYITLEHEASFELKLYIVLVLKLTKLLEKGCIQKIVDY